MTVTIYESPSCVQKNPLLAISSGDLKFTNVKMWVLWTDPNHQQLVWFKSDQPGVFKSPVLQHTQHVESLWAHGRLVGMRHGKRRWYGLCTPESAWQTQGSGQLCRLFSRWWKEFRASRAIGAIRWNKPLNHSGTAVWRSELCRWLQVGCQGRPSWIRRSGARLQCWHNWKQCPGTTNIKTRPPPTSRAQLCGFRKSVCDHRWRHQGLPRDADCTGPRLSRKRLVDCRHKVLSTRLWTEVPLQPFQCHICGGLFSL